MAQVPLLHNPVLDTNGDPYSGALIYIYEAGTTTPIDFYTDAALTTEAANPLVCDSAGLPPVAYAAPDDYKVVFKTAGDVTISTVDNYTVIDPATAAAVTSTTIVTDTTVTADDLDRMFNVDATSGDVTVTADSAALGNGFEFTLRLDSATGNAILQPGGGQTVNDAADYTLDAQYDSTTFRSNGAAGWDVFSQNESVTQLTSDNAIQRIQVALNAGRLTYTSSTVVTFIPFKGNYVCFPDGTSVAIGSSGITSTCTNATLDGTAAQTLGNTTLYYAYVYNNSGTLVIDWSTTGPATDATTGISIKTGVATRVLIGMAYTNSSGNFSDSATKRNVASWNNRRMRHMQANFTTDRAYASSSWGEVNSEIRCQFVSWGEAVQFSANPVADNMPGSNVEMNAAVTLDGGTTPTILGAVSDPAGGTYDATDSMSFASSGWFAAAIGFHYATLMARHDSSVTLDYTANTSISGAIMI